MPSNSKNPQAANLGALLKGLKEAGVDFILVGGVAAVAQGAPVTTVDMKNCCRTAFKLSTRDTKYLFSAWRQWST